jgi:hypothetical protein
MHRFLHVRVVVEAVAHMALTFISHSALIRDCCYARSRTAKRQSSCVSVSYMRVCYLTQTAVQMRHCLHQMLQCSIAYTFDCSTAS